MILSLAFSVPPPGLVLHAASRNRRYCSPAKQKRDLKRFLASKVGVILHHGLGVTSIVGSTTMFSFPVQGDQQLHFEWLVLLPPETTTVIKVAALSPAQVFVAQKRKLRPLPCILWSQVGEPTTALALAARGAFKGMNKAQLKAKPLLKAKSLLKVSKAQLKAKTMRKKQMQ